MVDLVDGREIGLSHTTIRRILNDFWRQPHRGNLQTAHRPAVRRQGTGRGWPLHVFAELGYRDVCREKSQIQALNREQPMLSMAPRLVEWSTLIYTRNGKTSEFAALDIATGAIVGKFYKRNRATEFLAFLKELHRRIPERRDVPIIMDNYATHKTQRVKEWLARRPHWLVHVTPTSASWLNQVERWCAELTRHQF